MKLKKLALDIDENLHSEFKAIVENEGKTIKGDITNYIKERLEISKQENNIDMEEFIKSELPNHYKTQFQK